MMGAILPPKQQHFNPKTMDRKVLARVGSETIKVLIRLNKKSKIVAKFAGYWSNTGSTEANIGLWCSCEGKLCALRALDDALVQTEAASCNSSTFGSQREQKKNASLSRTLKLTFSSQIGLHMHRAPTGVWERVISGNNSLEDLL